MLRRRDTFTLIELLVVISIISILIAILLPALAKARSSSKTVNCLVNIRSSGTAIMVYTNDYNSWTMSYYDINWDIDSGTTSDRYWPTPLVMGNYLPHLPQRGSGFATVCPDGSTSTSIDGGYYKVVMSYSMRGINSQPTYPTNFRFDSVLTNNGNADNNIAPESFTGSMSDHVWLFDSCAYTGSSGYTQHAGVDKGNFGVWHEGRGSVLFFDGHATVGLRRYDYLWKYRLPNGIRFIIDEL